MIQIYICEDNPEQLHYFKEIIQDSLLFHTLDETFTYAASSPEELLYHLENHPPEFGLYFLDICLDSDMNGIQLASKIRENDPLGEIVFITSRSEMCYLSFQYQVRALDFILKDQLELIPSKIAQCLETADRTYNKIKERTNQSFCFKIHGERIYINPNDIIYLETSKDAPHKIIVHTRSGINNLYGTLKEFSVSLSSYPNFVKCHQSVIVNKDHIQRVDKMHRQLFLTGGSHCPVSVRYLKDFL